MLTHPRVGWRRERAKSSVEKIRSLEGRSDVKALPGQAAALQASYREAELAYKREACGEVNRGVPPEAFHRLEAYLLHSVLRYGVRSCPHCKPHELLVTWLLSISSHAGTGIECESSNPE